MLDEVLVHCEKKNGLIYVHVKEDISFDTRLQIVKALLADQRSAMPREILERANDDR